MVLRVFVEKKPGFDVEAKALLHELRHTLGIQELTQVRLVNRYDVEGISQELFEACVPTVFSEPQSDTVSYAQPQATGAHVFAVEFLPGQFDQRANSASECIQLISQGERPLVASAKLYYLEGELTQEQVAAIKHYVINPVEAREAALDLPATLTQTYVEPPMVETLTGFCELSSDELGTFLTEQGLAMDLADLKFCQEYFANEHRDPTITEIKVIDTYWSDHCRHTTFGTQLTDVSIDDAVVQKAFDRYLELRHELGRENKPLCLMDMATIGAKYLAHTGQMTGLDQSDEINACTVKVKVDVDGVDEDWLFLFKNETHNHPTEIEPFGGAATCIGGAIRDPLSGRSYVYQAMRVTGAADPTAPLSATLTGKLPQRKICRTAAAGYSSYGNQIGLATGQVSELYHPGYVAKRMEIGAVVGATPQSHVRRECPAPGDVIVLLGGRTGRDGIGGATGSSKAHNVESLEKDGAEVQKGNALTERKLQRLFRREDACKLIKRCNDFGAGGVSVAIGELADGLLVDLNRVPKKYEGLDGTELAISESQERMAVALDPDDVNEFLRYAREENLEACVVATVTAEPRLRMQWQGATIVDLSREFLASNGAPKYQAVHVSAAAPYEPHFDGVADKPGAKKPSILSATGANTNETSAAAGDQASATLAARFERVVSDLNVASNKGLSERFDSTIGAGTVLMPFGGTQQLTPALAMVAKFPVLGETTSVSGMAWGFNPYLMSQNQYEGAYLSVVESVSKLIATGFKKSTLYLTFQEYFERLHQVPERWGKPTAALLGSLMAQLDLGIGAIGGKDSMSGSFEDLDVPPTLVSFAVGTGHVNDICSPEFKTAGHEVWLVTPAYQDDSYLPRVDALLALYQFVEAALASGSVAAASTPGYGGLAEALFKMSVGNKIGLAFNTELTGADAGTGASVGAGAGAEAGAGLVQVLTELLFEPKYASFVLEVDNNLAQVLAGNKAVTAATKDTLAQAAALMTAAKAAGVSFTKLAMTTSAYSFDAGEEVLDLAALQEAWEKPLEGVYPYRQKGEAVEAIAYSGSSAVQKVGAPAIKLAKPRVIIPVFPGNNCEYDSVRAFERAGATAEVFIVNNLTPQNVSESVTAFCERVAKSNIIMIPGGFSGGDEPDGSAKFICAFFRSPAVSEAVNNFLTKQDGLMLGICNGFQALIKLGLVPYGEIRAMDESCPTLTFNTIGRHQSSLVRTRVASTSSPWLSKCTLGDIHTIAISHGEGRLVATPQLLEQMKAGGQIATQYVDADGVPSMDLQVNPNGSVWAIEGITSPNGRILGKMGHSERTGAGLYQNVGGNIYQPLFEGGVAYFTE